MKEISYTRVMGYITERMSREGGVFLSAPGTPANTMTIGWGWMGWCWNKPVFISVIRPQRHTLGLLKKSGCFTVSIPTGEPLTAQLRMAGTQSGREISKFEGHGLTAAPAQKVEAPIVAECGLHLECRVLLAEEMLAGNMDAEILRRCYPGNDLHEMFFGEIVACYATDEAFAAKYAE